MNIGNPYMTKTAKQVARAKAIARTLGPFIAARYLCKREWSVEAALYIILGK